MNAILSDIRFAFRRLRKSPGVMIVAVLTLALGIGANTTVFSFVNAVLLRPLPYPRADRLVRLASVNRGLGVEDARSSHPNIVDWQDRSTLFEKIASFQEWDGAITEGDRSIAVRVNWVTPNLLPMLGVTPLHGRLLQAEDMDSGMLLPYGLWLSLFGGDEAVLGKVVQVDGTPATIVGILPPRVMLPARGLAPADQAFLTGDIRQTPWPRGLQLNDVIARLKPGVTVTQAQAEMDRIAAELETSYPETNRGWRVTVTDLKTWKTQIARPQLMALYAATAIILLIACLNVSNLLLMRGESRRKELAIRRVLGSTRLRLLRQILSETALLAVTGGIVGVVWALWSRGFLLRLAPESLGIPRGFGFDTSLLLSALAVTVSAALLSGLFPMLRPSRDPLSQTLGEAARSISPGRSRRRLLHGLVVGQMTVSVVLLTAAGLTLVSLQRLMHVDPGFARDNTLSFRVDPYPTPERTQRILAVIADLPGVRSVGGAGIELLNDVFSNGVRITADESSVSADGSAPTVDYWRVTTDYFAAAGIRLLAGRGFDGRDPYDMKGGHKVIVNEALAQRLFPHRDAVGRQVRLMSKGGPGAPLEIVGVVASIKHRGLQGEDVPILYAHAEEAPTYLVRSSLGPAVVTPAIREALRQVNPELILSRVTTLEHKVIHSMADRRFATLMIIVLAVLGTALAAIGLFGVISYAVTQRTGEIGVRMALGADGPRVLAMVLKAGARLVAAGILLGTIASLCLTRFLRSLLFEVSPTDPVTLLGVVTLLSFVALLACWIPARRAAGIDPMVALRYE